jgi:hypothetical protein
MCYVCLSIVAVNDSVCMHLGLNDMRARRSVFSTGFDGNYEVVSCLIANWEGAALISQTFTRRDRDIFSDLVGVLYDWVRIIG